MYDYRTTKLWSQSEVETLLTLAYPFRKKMENAVSEALSYAEYQELCRFLDRRPTITILKGYYFSPDHEEDWIKCPLSLERVKRLTKREHIAKLFIGTTPGYMTWIDDDYFPPLLQSRKSKNVPFFLRYHGHSTAILSRAVLILEDDFNESLAALKHFREEELSLENIEHQEKVEPRLCLYPHNKNQVELIQEQEQEHDEAITDIDSPKTLSREEFLRQQLGIRAHIDEVKRRNNISKEQSNPGPFVDCVQGSIFVNEEKQDFLITKCIEVDARLSFTLTSLRKQKSFLRKIVERGHKATAYSFMPEKEYLADEEIMQWVRSQNLTIIEMPEIKQWPIYKVNSEKLRELFLRAVYCAILNHTLVLVDCSSELNKDFINQVNQAIYDQDIALWFNSKRADLNELLKECEKAKPMVYDFEKIELIRMKNKKSLEDFHTADNDASNHEFRKKKQF